MQGSLVNDQTCVVDSEPVRLSDRKTDLALERLQLPDTIISRLRDIALSVRSSRWLQGPQWGVSFEQVVTMSRAIIREVSIEDLKVSVDFSIVIIADGLVSTGIISVVNFPV